MSENDSQPIISNFANDQDILDLVEQFVDDLPRRIAAIQQSLAQQDLDTLQRLTHQLKGSAGGYGFPDITKQAASVESSIKMQTEIDNVAREVFALADLCNRARATPDNDP